MKDGFFICISISIILLLTSIFFGIKETNQRLININIALEK